jgi:polysaccharide pyruvyl transferase WcaK-like protein
MERTNAHILLIPHEHFSFLIDGQKCNEIQICEKEHQLVDQQYHTRIHLVRREYNQNEIKGIIGTCDFFIGSRMHACIAALSQCIPAIGLAYSKKFFGVFQSIGVGEFSIDMRQKSLEEIIDAVISAFEHRNTIADNLKMNIPMVQNQIRNVFKEMLCESND